jgi:hypothetical protein
MQNYTLERGVKNRDDWEKSSKEEKVRIDWNVVPLKKKKKKKKNSVSLSSCLILGGRVPYRQWIVIV